MGTEYFVLGMEGKSLTTVTSRNSGGKSSNVLVLYLCEYYIPAVGLYILAGVHRLFADHTK